MDNKVYIDSGSLKEIANQLSENSEKMYSVYSQDIVSALEACQEDLKVSGLSYGEVNETFRNLFVSLRSQINGLAEALNTTILPEYESSAAAISKMFNEDFASKMNDYLTIMKK